MFVSWFVKEIYSCGKALFTAIPHRGSKTPETVEPSQLHLAKLFSEVTE